MLRRTSWTEAPVAGGSFAIDLELENRGFTAPYGPRDALLVLDGPSGRHEFPLTGEPETWIMRGSPAAPRPVRTTSRNGRRPARSAA